MRHRFEHIEDCLTIRLAPHHPDICQMWHSACCTLTPNPVRLLIESLFGNMFILPGVFLLICQHRNACHSIMNPFTKVVASAIEGISLFNMQVAGIEWFIGCHCWKLRLSLSLDSIWYRLLKHTYISKAVVDPKWIKLMVILIMYGNQNLALFRVFNNHVDRLV